MVGTFKRNRRNAFLSGEDSQGINENDPSGIGLAAAQELRKQHENLKIRNMDLEKRLSGFEAAMAEASSLKQYNTGKQK